MSFVDSFERGALFSITRFVALVGTVVLLLTLIGLIVVGVTQFAGGNDTTVKPQEVIQALKPEPPSTPGSLDTPTAKPASPASPLAGLKIPFALQKYVANPELARIVAAQVSRYPKEMRDSVLDELAAVVSEAERAKANVFESMDKYFELKSDRFAEGQRKAEERKQFRLYAAAAAVSILLLISILSLILVLLSIERNTRSSVPRLQG
jgi:hypothetical protein